MAQWLKKKFPPANAGDSGLIPSPGKSPGKGNSNPFPWHFPIFLPGKSHRQKGLGGYSQWSHDESNTNERLNNNICLTYSILEQPHEEEVKSVLLSKNIHFFLSSFSHHDEAVALCSVALCAKLSSWTLVFRRTFWVYLMNKEIRDSQHYDKLRRHGTWNHRFSL